jgi:hypothetical protein
MKTERFTTGNMGAVYTNVTQQDFIAKFNAAWEKENQMVPPLDLGVATFRRPIGLTIKRRP